MKKYPSSPTGSPPLKVWADHRPEPDWDRYLAALIALALARVETDGDDEDMDAKEDRER